MELTENKALLEACRAEAAALAEALTPEEMIFQTMNDAAPIPRLGIPAYNWWNEALHGVARAGQATVFPQAIGLAASFDEDLAEEVADTISTEARAKYNMQFRRGDSDIYKGLTFWAPNVNIFRDPRWGRGHETFGEDPYLTGRMGVRFIRGLQGRDERFLKAAACAKHFAVHSGPEDLRHGFNAEVSLQDLYETYLPAFRACVQEGHVEAVMGAYNRVNGVPCCGSRELLVDILREQWGFGGHVLSDCGALMDFHGDHGVTANAPQSAAMALENGCDLNCGKVFGYLGMARRMGLVDDARLREAVTNLYTTRVKLGVLASREKTPWDDLPYTLVECKEHLDLCRRAAEKTLVLLKNQGNLLPLDAGKIKTIGVIGPNANNRRALVGNYEGTASRYVTVLEGIQDYLGDSVRVLASEGCHLYKDRVDPCSRPNDRLSEVKEVCALSDAVIAVMGLDSGLEGEQGDENNAFASGDKPDLRLPGLQEDILKAICESGKPVVLVVLAGSCLDLSWAEENVPAIIQGWYPGARGGEAVARAIFGDVNPEGKLPVTFYRSARELPDFRDYSMEGRTYRYFRGEPLFPFGYGLSYTSFSCKILGREQEKDGVSLTCRLTNTGTRTGAETIQVYVEPICGTPQAHIPNPQLKALKKLTLAPGETRDVTLKLPMEAFGLYNQEGRLTITPGPRRVYAGTHGPDPRSKALTGTEPDWVEIRV